MKKLFNVTCEIMVDAENGAEAMERVYSFLAGNTEPDYNFLIHNAELDENFQILDDLRKHQAINKDGS